MNPAQRLVSDELITTDSNKSNSEGRRYIRSNALGHYRHTWLSEAFPSCQLILARREESSRPRDAINCRDCPASASRRARGALGSFHKYRQHQEGDRPLTRAALEYIKGLFSWDAHSLSFSSYPRVGYIDTETRQIQRALRTPRAVRLTETNDSIRASTVHSFPRINKGEKDEKTWFRRIMDIMRKVENSVGDGSAQSTSKDRHNLKTKTGETILGPLYFSAKCKKHVYRLYHNTRDCTVPASHRVQNTAKPLQRTDLQKNRVVNSQKKGMHLPEDITVDSTRQGETCKTSESEESIWPYGL
ncbi:ALK and LTK ligand 2 [Triplophysa tibetana]|uniref:ALK and LTK ligand 2 n=1 Tax=Triplophysa tibetana TaxID=1572043 RepID=A0A5A9NCB9_9TELE|nr:ALK and LTK ligand 2 [Triplophysa tibetana]